LLGPGEHVRSAERKGRWTLRFTAKRSRTYRLQAAMGTLRRPFAVCAVSVGGRKLARSAWRYEAGAQLLRATFRAGKRERIVARPCRD